MPCSISTDVARAAKILRAGGLVAFATETVYGLGADAFNPRAVARIFEAKQRPSFDPLIVHVADPSWLERLATAVADDAWKLADRFWPGPLTLVLPKRSEIPDIVTSGLPTVAVRIPGHPQALDLIRTADCPVAAPSANLFGRLSPTSAEHVAEQLGERIDLILDGGPCRVGVESTVVQIIDSHCWLLRPGGITVEEIEATVGPVELPERSAAGSPSAPGMLPQHYAPSTPLLLVRDFAEIPAAAHIGLLSLQPCEEPRRFDMVEVLSETGDLPTAAANFFAALRRLDAAGLDLIVAQLFPEHGLGRTLNDRLRRAHVGDCDCRIHPPRL